MRPTTVVAVASFIFVLALAGCVRMTAAPPVAPHGGAPGLTTLQESIRGILVDPAKFAKLR
jgi:hypothetical protein